MLVCIGFRTLGVVLPQTGYSRYLQLACGLLSKIQTRNQFLAIPLIPLFWSFDSNILWSTVSDAFAKSKSTLKA